MQRGRCGGWFVSLSGDTAELGFEINDLGEDTRVPLSVGYGIYEIGDASLDRGSLAPVYRRLSVKI